MGLLGFLPVTFLSCLIGAQGYAQCAAAPVGTMNDPVLQMRLNGDGLAALGPANSINSTEEGAIVWDDANNQLAVCDGTTWNNIGGVVGVGSEFTEFLTSGTWTKPAGITWVYVEAIGGGGSGARGTNAGGGGGGAFSSALFRSMELGNTETITIGAGGAVPSFSSDGNDGENSSFGSHLTAPGGKGGTDDNGGDGGGGERGGWYEGGNSTDIRSFSVGGYSSGGGGAPESNKSLANGANSIAGGAGGGGKDNGGAGTGGISQRAGNGGAGSSSSNGENGYFPGGGGGAAGGSLSGSGGTGRIRIWAW